MLSSKHTYTPMRAHVIKFISSSHFAIFYLLHRKLDVEKPAINKRKMTLSICLQTRIWKIRRSGHRCSSVWILPVLIFSSKHSGLYHNHLLMWANIKILQSLFIIDQFDEKTTREKEEMAYWEMVNMKVKAMWVSLFILYGFLVPSSSPRGY